MDSKKMMAALAFVMLIQMASANHQENVEGEKQAKREIKELFVKRVKRGSNCFECSPGGQCVSYDDICNSTPQCNNGADEDCCGPPATCLPNLCTTC